MLWYESLLLVFLESSAVFHKLSIVLDLLQPAKKQKLNKLFSFVFFRKWRWKVQNPSQITLPKSVSVQNDSSNNLSLSSGLLSRFCLKFSITHYIHKKETVFWAKPLFLGWWCSASDKWISVLSVSRSVQKSNDVNKILLDESSVSASDSINILVLYWRHLSIPMIMPHKSAFG